MRPALHEHLDAAGQVMDDHSNTLEENYGHGDQFRVISVRETDAGGYLAV